MPSKNKLYYGDNLEILRSEIDAESVDLIYIDPPYNTNANYSMNFKQPDGSETTVQAFGDIWRWDEATAMVYDELINSASEKVASAVKGFRSYLGDNNLMAYLVHMAVRLIELHRVLKRTGSFYLHCNPTASHYLKILLDQIFGLDRFQSEISWCYHARTTSRKYWGKSHDIIFFYTRSEEWTFNWRKAMRPMTEYTRHRRGDHHVDEEGRRYRLRRKGKAVREGLLWEWLAKTEGADTYREYAPDGYPERDWWSMRELGSYDKTRDYPTQKPEEVLERIISVSSNEGDLVLDAFSGGGTTVTVAERLKRRWIGIDKGYLSMFRTETRLKTNFGANVNYEIIGNPSRVQEVKALSRDDREQLLWWTFSRLNGSRPYAGIGEDLDGVVFYNDVDRQLKEIPKKVIIKVKDGETDLQDIEKFQNIIDNENAVIGAFISLDKVTEAIYQKSKEAGSYDRFGVKYPKLQILTVDDLLAGKDIERPRSVKISHLKQVGRIDTDQQLSLA